MILYIFSVFKMGNQCEKISKEICAQDFNQLSNLSKELRSPAIMALRLNGEYCRIQLKLLKMCIFFNGNEKDVTVVLCFGKLTRCYVLA